MNNLSSYCGLVVAKIRASGKDLPLTVFLLRQLWIVNYYVKTSSNNLSNENIKTGLSREMIFENSLFWHFDSCFALKTTETPVFMVLLPRLPD